MNQLSQESNENELLENKAGSMEKNAVMVYPERLREANEKIEQVSNVLQGKDTVID